MIAGFEISTAYFVILLVFVFLAGFVDASAGGGGLVSLPAYMFVGLPAHFALGTNKFSSTCGTVFAALKFWKSGTVDARVALASAAASLIGSYLGARTALLLSGEAVKTALIIALPCAAAIIFCRKDFGSHDRFKEKSAASSDATATAVGLLIGGYDGLLGPGTGTFAIIAFSAIMGYDLKRASGNAKVLNLASNAASLAAFAAAGTVVYGIAIPAACCNVAGSFIGSRCALSAGARFIRPMLLVVLALLMLRLIADVVF